MTKASIGDSVIFLHDGPDGIAILTKVDRVEGDHIVITCPAGEYRFLNGRFPMPTVSKPDAPAAQKFDTWLIEDNEINRDIYEPFQSDQMIEFANTAPSVVS